MKETIKILFTFEVDTETGETKTLSKELVNKKTSTKSTSTKINDDDPNPKIILEENKYIINKAAAEMMDIEPGDRIDIKYRKVDGVDRILIGTNTSFGTKAGNKLTNSYTVSYKGKNNEVLSEYGDEFEVIPLDAPDLVGLFMLKGNKEQPQVQTTKTTTFKLPSNETEVDLSELTDNSDLQELLDGDTTEIKQVEFNLNK